MRKYYSIIPRITRAPNSSPSSSSSIILIALACFFLAAFIYSAIARPLLEQYSDAAADYLPRIPGGLAIKTLLVMLFSVFHAAYALGWRRTLAFFALAAAISWTYEQVGVETGLIYGKYHYTDALGPKLGHVPIIIPVAWFMMIYPSYIIANLVTKGRFVTAGGKGKTRVTTATTTNPSPPAADTTGAAMTTTRSPTQPLPIDIKRTENADSGKKKEKKKQNLVDILWLSLVGAMVMTAWDFVVDPYLSGPNQLAWIWEEGGSSPYFGVPLQNFGGWILTTFTIYLVYRVLENKIADGSPRRKAVAAVPISTTTNNSTASSLSSSTTIIDTGSSSVPVPVIAMPVLAYGAMMISNIIPQDPPSLLFLGPLIMGAPLILAAIRLWQLKKQRQIHAAAGSMPVKAS